MLICIPMAGRSSRFYDAGYTVPKFMLDLNGRPIFDHAISSFSRYFQTATFLFFALNSAETEKFIHERCKYLNIKNFKITSFEIPTSGQAETVYLGLKNMNISESESILIFNIDSFRPDFKIYDAGLNAAGYLEVFEGDGDNWSYVVENKIKLGFASAVYEKKRISNWCSNGMYFFQSLSLYNRAYLAETDNPSQLINERYISPIYNQLIMMGYDILMYKLNPNDTIFCGTPKEYEELRCK